MTNEQWYVPYVFMGGQEIGHDYTIFDVRSGERPNLRLIEAVIRKQKASQNGHAFHVSVMTPLTTAPEIIRDERTFWFFSFFADNLLRHDVISYPKNVFPRLIAEQKAKKKYPTVITIANYSRIDQLTYQELNNNVRALQPASDIRSHWFISYRAHYEDFQLPGNIITAWDGPFFSPTAVREFMRRECEKTNQEPCQIYLYKFFKINPGFDKEPKDFKPDGRRHFWFIYYEIACGEIILPVSLYMETTTPYFNLPELENLLREEFISSHGGGALVNYVEAMVMDFHEVTEAEFLESQIKYHV